MPSVAKTRRKTNKNTNAASFIEIWQGGKNPTVGPDLLSQGQRTRGRKISSIFAMRISTATKSRKYEKLPGHRTLTYASQDLTIKTLVEEAPKSYISPVHTHLQVLQPSTIMLCTRSQGYRNSSPIGSSHISYSTAIHIVLVAPV